MFQKTVSVNFRSVIFFFLVLIFSSAICDAQQASKFRAIAFYTGKEDLAHISFVKEANEWFAAKAKENHFSYDTTTNWNNMNDSLLAKYRVVIFLDTRPDSLPQRQAFEKYMKNGGAWMGFHFSAFALTPSAFPQNWNWYHNEFLGAGSYASNTWHPTAALLKVEKHSYPFTKNMADTFTASPSEWYRWENDLKKNTDIDILLSVDERSFPLGTGPKPYEIWHSGYYPVAWVNKKYRMIYFNMGHNDMDYDGGTNATLSHTFGNKVQDKLILQSLLWLASAGNKTFVHN
jgi:hypothetical protein